MATHSSIPAWKILWIEKPGRLQSTGLQELHELHDLAIKPPNNSRGSYKYMMKVKEESEKVGLKLNIQKTKIMASGPTTSWEIDGETVSDFILGGSKITADVIAAMKLKDAYSLEGKLWPT